MNPNQAGQANHSSVPRSPAGSVLDNSSHRIAGGEKNFLGRQWDFWVLRGALLAGVVALCYTLSPFGFHGLPAAGVGFLAAMIILLAELRMRHAELSGLVGRAVGTVLGLLAALLATLVISRTAEPEPTKSFFEFTSLFAFGYLGLIAGSSKAKHFRNLPLAATAEISADTASGMKLLDTSVLIDGRIADICETHFLDGTLGVPRFVLHELQMVADSGDSLKRQRGRRGLEVLQRMQKMPSLSVRLVEDDIGGSVGVDQKMMELARRTCSKIVTNDFNLNKVARVQGIPVLNVNELANAMKPAVLPGEPMRVLILREGKESTQGVAYLDDGTMVVVDGARRMINRTVDILVTSVHQTPAGKMIFGKLEDRGDFAGHQNAAPRDVPRNGPGNGNGSGRPEPPGKFETPTHNSYSDTEPA